VLELRILGPLEVWHDGRAVVFGSPRGPALLGTLLVHRGEAVAADALVQALWGDEAPPTAGKALQVSVSRLRRSLGPVAERVQTTGGGYRLLVEADELDADRFARGYERGRGLLSAGAPAEAAVVLRDALALWRGPPLADLRYEAWAQAEIRRLEELRVAALEERIEAELALGEHGRLIGELEALAAEHPLRERLCAQQMLALYRSGRHADALAVFRDMRARLDGELGLEPGPELRALEQAILTHDPSLTAAEDPTRLVPAPSTPTFGREHDVRAVLTALERTRLLTLTGLGGVGKTRLAIEVARAAGGRFAELAPIASADRIPAVVCDALAVTRVPDESDAAALDRAVGREPLLLVLDNLEHLPDAAPLIAGLLERHPALTLLTTSRHPLRLRAERLYPVAPLTGARAMELFIDRALARDPAFVADDAVAEICRRVGGLPLAIELAAARLGVLTPAQLAERLGNALGVLDRGPRDAPERQRTLRATLDWSFELLDDEERRAFSALGAFAGGCDVEAAEAVTGGPLTVLEGLADKSLVIAAGGRLRVLEPVRQYAAERLAERPDAGAVRLRHLLHYLSVAQRCEVPVWVRHRSCPEFATLRREHENLRAAISFGLESGEALRVVELVSAIAFYMWYSHDRSGQLRRWCDHAVAAAGDDVPLSLLARAEFAVGFNSSDPGERFRHDLAALALFRELDDDMMVARCLVDLAMTARLDGDPARAVAHGAEAVEHARHVGDDGVLGAALAELSGSTLDVAATVPLARAAVTHLRAAGAHELAAQVLSDVCLVAALGDAHEMGEQLGNEAAAAAAAVGDVWTIAYVQGNVAAAALLGDRHEGARAGLQEGLMITVAHSLPRFTRFVPLHGLAALAAATGEDRRAAVLSGAAWAIDTRPVDYTGQPVNRRLEQRFLAPARERLGSDAWEAANNEGRHMTADAAIAFALQPALLPD
jgi:predicted ATPase/DNA-binding SARP family transcriptional activator